MSAHVDESQPSQSTLAPLTQATDPVTPQLQHAELPVSTPEASTIQHVQAKRVEQASFKSPPPPATSMTPPPSSQMPTLTHAASSISQTMGAPPTSPPPTIQANGADRAAPSAERIADAPLDDLRTIAFELSAALQEARASAAHHRLQYEMACMESSELEKRLSVELEMAQRDVQALIDSDRRRSTGFAKVASSETSPFDTETVNDLIKKVNTLNSERTRNLRHIKHLTREVEDHEGSIAHLREQNELLRSRIRENREHFNRLRRSGYILDTPRPAELPPFVTPARPRHAPPPNRGRDIEPLSALLLADQMLSAASPTPTPASKLQTQNGKKLGHARGAHSMSSLPSTPTRKPRTVESHHYRTPTAPSVPVQTPASVAAQISSFRHYVTPEQHNGHAHNGSRHEQAQRGHQQAGDDAHSDATWSDSEQANDAKDDATEADTEASTERGSVNEHDIHPVAESRASQAATDMLRRSTASLASLSQSRDNLDKSGSATKKGARSGKGAMKQTQITGQIRKSGVDRGLGISESGPGHKRKFSSGEDIAGKKAKLNEGVGLGIGAFSPINAQK